jgi:hypothetical protein
VGVQYDSSRNRFVVRWYEDGKKRSRRFKTEVMPTYSTRRSSGPEAGQARRVLQSPDLRPHHDTETASTGTQLPRAHAGDLSFATTMAASLTWRRMRTPRRFAVNIFGAQHADDIRDRARPGANRLAGLDMRTIEDGVPVVGDGLAALVGRLVSEHVAGDHTIAAGRVEEIHSGDGRAPLVFFEGRFGTVRMRAS